MYIDISVRKLLPLLVIACLLAGSVTLTFAAKTNEFGSTPFYYAIGLGWKKATGYAAYSAELALGNVIDRARAAFGFAPPASDATGTGDALAIPVLAYHRISGDGLSVTLEQFEDQMEALDDAGWQTITLAEFEAFRSGERSLPAKSVLITFDDGAKDSYYPVDPVLRAHGFNAVSYIIVNGSETDESTYYLSRQEIKNMLETGRWEIGSHSVAGHEPILIDAAGREGHFFSDRGWLLDESREETETEFTARVANDLAESKRFLESTYDVEVGSFAFPFGDAGEESTNFSEGNGITIREAEDVYRLGFVQTRGGEFSYNSESDAFLVRRIKVLPGWSGADLLAALHRGFQKALPYQDNLDNDNGWISSWGEPTLSDGMLHVSAAPQSSGASAFLDGTAHWSNYAFEASGNWTRGYALLMAAMKSSEDYVACVFSPGHVQLQRVSGDSRRTIAERDDSRIRHGAVALGIRAQNTTVQCSYDGAVVLSGYAASTAGGIGIQVWNESLGTARFNIESIAARDVRGQRIPAAPRERAETPAALIPLLPNTGAPVVPPAPTPQVPLPETPAATPPQPTSSEPVRSQESEDGRTEYNQLKDLIKMELKKHRDRENRTRGRNPSDR